jgi:hypothetical protein
LPIEKDQSRYLKEKSELNDLQFAWTKMHIKRQSEQHQENN